MNFPNLQKLLQFFKFSNSCKKSKFPPLPYIHTQLRDGVHPLHRALRTLSALQLSDQLQAMGINVPPGERSGSRLSYFLFLTHGPFFLCLLKPLFLLVFVMLSYFA